MQISIITVTYNDLEGLQKTTESVFKQTFKNIEYIVIDGGSTDGSAEYLTANSEAFAYWVSEPDAGIYAAMNKGIDKATGDYLLFLNSGDYLIDSTTIKSFVSLEVTEAIVYGRIKWKKGEEIWDGDFSNNLTFKYFSKASLPHQASFIDRKLFKEVGVYDESLQIVSDWKFFVLALYKHNCSYRRIDMFISVCNRDGLSCLPESWPLIVKEREQTLNTYFPAFYSDLAVYKKSERKMKQKIVRLEKKQNNWISRIITKIVK